MIEATEKFPGGGGIWSPGMDLWTFEQLFSPGSEEFEQKFSKTSNARGGGGCLSFDLTDTLREALAGW